jgi:hypothetical protein
MSENFIFLFTFLFYFFIYFINFFFLKEKGTCTFLVGQEKYQKNTATLQVDRLCGFAYAVLSAPRTDFA